MSIVSMSSARIARQTAGSKSGPLGPVLTSGRAADPTTPTPPTREGILTQLLRYTPTEAIGFYLAVVGFLPAIPDEEKRNVAIWNQDFRPRWIVFLIFVGITLLAVWAVHRENSRRANVSFQWPWFELVAATIAFSAWAMALPLAPLFSWNSWAGWIGTVVAAITLVVLAPVAKGTGKALTYSSSEGDT